VCVCVEGEWGERRPIQASAITRTVALGDHTMLVITPYSADIAFTLYTTVTTVDSNNSYMEGHTVFNHALHGSNCHCQMLL